jgi:hypothetical protein
MISVNSLETLDRNDRKHVAESIRILAGLRRGKRYGLKALVEADRFEQCRTSFGMFTCTDCRSAFSVPCSCNSRICPDCARRYYARMFPHLEDMFSKINARRGSGYFFSLVTLTYNTAEWNGELPTYEQQKEIWKKAAILLNLYWGKRKGRLSKKNNLIVERISWKGAGWLAVAEFGSNNNNFHIHALVYGHRVPYNSIRDSWNRLTGAKVIDVKPIVNYEMLKKALRYIVKYMYKPPVHDYVRLAELAINMKGLRRFRTGGIFYNKIKPIKPERLHAHCPYCLGMISFAGVCKYTDSDSRITPLYESLKLLKSLKDTQTLPFPLYSDRFDEGKQAAFYRQMIAQNMQYLA